jgi:hypothetical protein
MPGKWDDLVADIKYIRDRVDALHEKHEQVCQRVVKTETDLRWVKGSARISITGIITVIAALIAKYFIK